MIFPVGARVPDKTSPILCPAFRAGSGPLRTLRASWRPHTRPGGRRESFFRGHAIRFERSIPISRHMSGERTQRLRTGKPSQKNSGPYALQMPLRGAKEHEARYFYYTKEKERHQALFYTGAGALRCSRFVCPINRRNRLHCRKTLCSLAVGLR